jgi:hypothetical protein
VLGGSVLTVPLRVCTPPPCPLRSSLGDHATGWVVTVCGDFGTEQWSTHPRQVLRAWAIRTNGNAR